MTLFDLQYGFFDPASLFVFFDPYSPYPSVQKELSRLNSDGASVSAALYALDEAEQDDFLQRLTALVHERQHFHDLLLTPHGVTIAYAALLVGLRSVAVLLSLRLELDSAGSAGEITIQLPLTDGAPVRADHLDNLRETFSLYTGLVDRARATLELSAILTQMSALGDVGGAAAQYAVLRRLRRHPLYSDAFVRLESVFQQLRMTGGDARRGARVLVLAALTTVTPDELLHATIGRLESIARTGASRASEALANAMLEHYETVALKNIEQRSSEAARMTEGIRHEHGQLKLAQELYTPFLRAAEDLAQTTEAGQQLWRSGVGSVVGSLIDSTTLVPEPYFYAYAAFAERSLTESALDGYPQDDLFELQYFRKPDWPAGKQLTAQMLRPVDAFGFEESGQLKLTKTCWLEMAKSSGGAVSALLQPIDRTNPLQRVWLRGVSERFGMRFVRRPIRH